MATIRDGWKIPEPPIFNVKGEVRPYAYNTGGEWLLAWGIDYGDGLGEIESAYLNEGRLDEAPDNEDDYMIDWPFVEDFAKVQDLKAAGFEIL